MQVLNVDGVHQRLLGQQHGLLRRAADADAENARRAPARAHGGHGLEHPLDNGIRGVEHDELRLGLGASALGRDGDFDRRRRGTSSTVTTAGVLSLVFLRAPAGSARTLSAQLVVGIEIGAAHAFVHHLLQVDEALRRARTRSARPCPA